MAGFVLIQLAPAPDQRHALEDRVTIGREGADLVVDDPEVSRHHAEIKVTDGEISVVDLGSRNGTFVNDEQVSGREALAPGDVLRVGHVSWRLAPTHVGPGLAEDPGATRARGDVPPPAPSALAASRAAVDAGVLPGFGRASSGRRPVSAARRGWATIVCFAIVAADAIALAIYFATR